MSKLACDHNRPVCSRCARRGRPDGCVYRTNPFKRARKTASVAEPQPGTPQPWFANSSSEFPVALPHALRVTLYPDPGFQGLSSSTTILEAIEYGAANDYDSNQSTPSGGDMDNSGDEDIESAQCQAILRGGTAIVEQGVQVLEMVADIVMRGTLQRIFDHWVERDLESHAGSFLVASFLRTITSELCNEASSPDKRSHLTQLSHRLFNAGSVPVEVSQAKTLDDFVTRHTGRNLRWETIGTVLALAGNAASDIRAPHAAFDTEKERQATCKCLLDACTRCASICESLDVLNDVFVIFLHETFLFYSVYFGDQSFHTWRRLNDAISALFARGLHQRLDKDPQMPVFLVELRKQIFARVYVLDISFAAFLGRPPRISKRHCMIPMPLDIDREALRLTAEPLNEELSHLDRNGWNKQGEIRIFSALRWSVMASKIREEILEAMLGPEVKERQQLIRTLRVRIEEAWNSLPSHLTVSASEVWARGRSADKVDSLYLIRLIYLQAVFLVEWAATVHGTADVDALYIISGDLLAWVNEAMIRRERLNKLGLSSLAWRVAACGLPAAGALARCMMPGPLHPSRQWQSTVAQVKIVQDLSILMGHMDYLHEPGDGNYKLFQQAKKVLKEVIETVLRIPGMAQADAQTQNYASHSWSPLQDPGMDHWLLNPESWIGSFELDAFGL